MNTEKRRHPGALKQIAAGLAVLAGITGIYWFQTDGRKTVPSEAAALATVVPSNVTRELATRGAGCLSREDGAQTRHQPRPSVEHGRAGRLERPRDAGQSLGHLVCALPEMPALAQLQKDLGSDQFEVVAISVDKKGVEASAAFLKETGAENLRLYVEPTLTILNDLQAIGLPATILIDRQGRRSRTAFGPCGLGGLPESHLFVKAALVR